MQPHQYDLWCPAAKDDSIAHRSRGPKQPWRSHYNAISAYWRAKRYETTRNGVRNCSSKTGSRGQRKKRILNFEALFNRNFQEKFTRYFSSQAAATLHGKKKQVSCPGFLPNTAPMQHSCYDNNALSSTKRLTDISLRTWRQNVTRIMQPLLCNLQPEIRDA